MQIQASSAEVRADVAPSRWSDWCGKLLAFRVVVTTEEHELSDAFRVKEEGRFVRKDRCGRCGIGCGVGAHSSHANRAATAEKDL